MKKGMVCVDPNHPGRHPPLQPIYTPRGVIACALLACALLACALLACALLA